MIDGTVIERLADQAWPAAETVAAGPWKLRASRGVSRRANSVFTVGTAKLAERETEKLIESAELFYAERQLPACFYLSPYSTPPNLESMLVRRGYVMGQVVQVWTASVGDLIARMEVGADPGEPRLADDADEQWLGCAFPEQTGKREIHETIVRRVPSPRRFVSMRVDDMVGACGMGVSLSGYCGIFCMATREPYRRRGLAVGVLRQIISWARARGDRWMYLQVLSDNLPAQGLYRKIGMAPAYEYRYRIRAV